MSPLPAALDSSTLVRRWSTIGAVLAASVATAAALTPAHGATLGTTSPSRIGVASLPAASSAHAIIRTIPLPRQGRAVGVGSEAGDPIYIAAGDSFGGQLLRVDPQTLTQTGSVAVGTYPKGLAVSGDDTVYVINADSDNMSVVKGSTMTVASTVTVPDEPQAVGVSRTSDDTIFVSNSGVGGTAYRITSINARTLSLGPHVTLGVGTSPYGLAVGLDDSVYVSSYPSDTIFRYNGRTNSVSSAFTGAQGPIGVAVTDSNLVYFTRETGNAVTRFPANSPGSSSTIPVSDPQGIAIGPDDTVYVAGRFSSRISVIDPQTFAVDDSVSVNGQPLSVAVTQTGLVVTADSGGNAAWIIAQVRPTLPSTSGQAGTTGTIQIGGLPTGVVIDDTTVTSVRFGGVSAPGWSRVAGTNTLTGTIPNGTGTVAVTVTLNGGDTASAGAFTYTVPPPAPPVPASVPLDVAATAGNASARVTWAAPASSGSFPISHYQAISSPGGRTCLVAASTLTCEVPGLTNGATYTFTVKALNGAGWSPSSDPSNAVVPRASAEPTIVITGAREGKRIVVTGRSTGLVAGALLTPHVARSLEAFKTGIPFAAGADGSITWSRRASETLVWRVYLEAGDVRSNTVTIR